MIQNFNWQAEAKWLEPEQLGSVLVIAPHQDDESLGCGGTIALMRNNGLPVHVLFVTDGSKSHPNSKEYPMEKLIALREQESIHALDILGVDQENITFLRLPDGALPGYGEEGFASSVTLISGYLRRIKPDTILFPWQRDPHRDHRATWQTTVEALKQSNVTARKLEYLIWLWERADVADLPQPGEVSVWQTNIEIVKNIKKEAIRAHVSQTTDLISDDPDGFTLSADVLAHFDKNTEIFIERI